MASNLTTADGILKELYLGPIVEMLNQKAYLLDQLERDSESVDFTGRQAVIPVHSGRNKGKRAIGDAGTFAAAGNQEFQDAKYKITYQTLSIQLSDAIMKQTESNVGAFVSALDAETQGAATDLRKDINRQAFGRGPKGGLVQPEGLKKESKTTLLEFKTEAEMQYLEVGDVIDVLVESTGAKTNGIEGSEITEISLANKTATIKTGLTAELAAETYNVYISGNYGHELHGLREITETERTLGEINSATAGNNFWNGNQVNVGTAYATPAVATEDSFIQLFDEVGAKGNGDVEVCLTSRGIRRRLTALYQSQKRYNDANAVKIEAGYSAIMVNEVPVIIDDMCPFGSAFAFNKSALKILENGKAAFFEGPDGHAWFPATAVGGAGYSANWQAFLLWNMQLGAVAPNRTGRLNYCTDNTVEEGEVTTL